MRQQAIIPKFANIVPALVSMGQKILLLRISMVTGYTFYGRGMKVFVIYVYLVGIQMNRLKFLKDLTSVTFAND